jgi:hypothetical protein
VPGSGPLRPPQVPINQSFINLVKLAKWKERQKRLTHLATREGPEPFSELLATTEDLIKKRIVEPIEFVRALTQGGRASFEILLSLNPPRAQILTISPGTYQISVIQNYNLDLIFCLDEVGVKSGKIPAEFFSPDCCRILSSCKCVVPQFGQLGQMIFICLFGFLNSQFSEVFSTSSIKFLPATGALSLFYD